MQRCIEAGSTILYVGDVARSGVPTKTRRKDLEDTAVPLTKSLGSNPALAPPSTSNQNKTCSRTMSAHESLLRERRINGNGNLPASSNARQQEEQQPATSVLDGLSFYEILGVDESADDAALSRSFKKLALKMHPDKGGNPSDFIRLRRAYDTLKDPNTRSVYDRYGEAGVGMMEGNFDADKLAKAFGSASSEARWQIVFTLVCMLLCMLLPIFVVCLAWDSLVPGWVLKGSVRFRPLRLTHP